MTNNNRNINNIFYIFVTAHLIFWTLIPSLTNQNLPLDTIEALAWGSNLDWGFNKHPPMSAFFPEVFFQIFGAQDWVYYLLSQIFVIISFYYVFKFSQEFLKSDLLSLISVLLIEAIYFYNFTTPEFNVNVCQLPFWSLTVYFSWKIYTSKEIKFSDCFLVGLFAAFGFLSKYLFVYLLVSIDLLFIYLIFIKKDRKFDFKYLISLEVFLIILVPHLIWLNNNEFITITYGLARTGFEQSGLIDHIKFPLIFLIKQIGILIPFLILVWLLVKKIKFRIDFKDKKLLFLLAINILPIILMFLTSVVTGSKIRTMWMTPFYLFFGTLFVYLFQAQINIKKLKPFMIGFIFFFFLSPALYAYVSISKEDKRTDYPGKEIAIKTQYAWDQQFNSNINVVYGNEWNAGNLSYHLKSRPIWDGIVEREKLDQLKDYMCLDNVCVGSK
ncbi:glycosyltransferase family 39 protein [Candidatus Pelagibacter sp.]|nr:glycosyltransferase family 39 protein [Candidatus Pelagibacter sp.]